MARLLQAVLLGLLALRADAGPTDCADMIEDLRTLDPLTFAKQTLSCGKSLPYDAGKFGMCVNGKHNRYFLVKAGAKFGTYNGTFPLEFGLCVPDVCDHAGIVSLVKSKTVLYLVPDLAIMILQNITASSPQLDMKNEDVGGIIAATSVCCLILLVFLSSAFVLVKQSRPQELPQHQQVREAGQQLLQQMPQQEPTKHPLVIEAFSMFGKSGTLVKLVEIPPYKPTDSLNGLRVLSMFWIILGHTFLMPQGISGYQNEQDIELTPLNSDTAEESPWLGLIVSAQAGVDTFFFLSGFLLSYLGLKECREGRMKVLPAIILRYARLTPSLGLAMLVYYKIWVYFAHGPFAVRFQESINERCDGSWWSELTYTLNFIPFDSNKVCMGWTWYLGDDMIFFIIAMLILPLYHWRRWMGWLSIIVLTVISLVVTTWLVEKYNLGIYIFDKHYTDYSYWAYSKPYTRIPAYFVGMVTAWLLDELEQRGITRETRSLTAVAKISAKVVAALCFVILTFLVFIPTADFGKHKNSWSPFTNVMYIDFSRPVWAMCFGVLTLLCYYDYLPLVNGFLSHSWWTPFARLTYGAYLVHPLVIKLAAGRSLQYYMFNSWDMSYRFVGNVVFAYSGSCMLWVLCERPFMTIFSPARKTRRKGNTGTASERHGTISESHGGSTPDVSRGNSIPSVGNDVSNSDIKSGISLPPATGDQA